MPPKFDDENKENCAPGKTPGRAYWTSDDKAALVDFLLDQLDLSRDADNNFKPSVWTELAKKLNESHLYGALKTDKACKKQFEKLSRLCRLITELRQNHTGLGFDSEMGRVTAPEDVWKTIIQNNPKYAPLKKKSFPFYDDICTIIGGKAAMGRRALSISNILNLMVTESSDTESHTSDMHLDTLHLDNDESTQQSTDTNEKVVVDTPEPSQPNPTPNPTRHGRKRAASPFSDNKQPSKKRKEHPSASAAVTSVADALRDLGSSFSKRKDDGCPPTPKRLSDAVKQAQVDKTLDVGERVVLMRLFSERISFVDTYLALDDEEIRAVYITIEVLNEGEGNCMLRIEEEQVKAICEKIIELKPDHIFTDKGILDHTQHYLEANITAIRHMCKSVINHQGAMLCYLISAALGPVATRRCRTYRRTGNAADHEEQAKNESHKTSPDHVKSFVIVGNK